jgi:hypothetical protein
MSTIDWFFAPTRIKSDTHAPATNDFSSTGRHTLDVNAACSASLNPASAMAEQVGMIASGGHGQPAMGCAVDTNTELRWGTPGAWRTKGQKQLWARPFGTTPFLGGGEPTAVDDESNLIHSALIRNRKESSTIMDKAIPNFYDPLIPIKASEYSNPANWIQSWTRGGEVTRLAQTKRVDA